MHVNLLIQKTTTDDDMLEHRTLVISPILPKSAILYLLHNQQCQSTEGTRLFNVGDCAFGATAACIWNSLPSTAETFNSFRKH